METMTTMVPVNRREITFANGTWIGFKPHCLAVIVTASRATQRYREGRITIDQLKEKLHMDDARIKELLADNVDLTRVRLWRST
jgi:hypothetical protein